MKCPVCGVEGQHYALDTRQSKDGLETVRRRRCGICGARFTTRERIDYDRVKEMKK